MAEVVEIERSIIKKYRKEIWKNFISGVNEYNLISDGDKIAVCISGGKDSFLLAKCMQEIKKHGKIKFDLEFICMNPGYLDKNLTLIEGNAKKLDIPLKIFNTEIFNYVNTLDSGSPCYLCARMRRGYLYDYAKSLGCNKIALGHHYDDVIETILLSVLYSGEFRTMMPKLHSTNFEEIDLIRPLYMVREADIISWANYNNLKFLNCACRFTEKCSTKEMESKRYEVKNLIKNLRATNPYIEKNIFKSAANVNLDAIIGYRSDNGNYNFLDDYDK